MKRLTGKQKAYKLLLSRGATGITSAELATMYDGRTHTARINELVHEGKATSRDITVGGVVRAWYRLIQYDPSRTTTRSPIQPQTPKKPIRYEYRGNTAIPIYG